MSRNIRSFRSMFCSGVCTMHEENRRAAISFAVTVLGVSHIVTQVTVIREFINVFAGNEIVLGVLFSLWLIFTGIGAWTGRFLSSLRWQYGLFRVMLFIAAVLPFVHIIAVRYFRGFVFMRGEMPGVDVLVITAAVVVLPYCLMTGLLLTLACGLLTRPGASRQSIGFVYFFDNIGDILGGLIFTFFLVRFGSTFTMLFVPAVLCLLALCFLRPLGSSQRSLLRFVMGIGGIVLIGAGIFFLSPDGRTLKWLYPGETILHYRESPYGRVVVTAQDDQKSFFENGALLFSTPNTFAAEETVHYALSQRAEIDDVLIVSGGIAGTVGEALKYHPRRIDYVELDPYIIAAARRHRDLAFPPGVTVHIRDGRRFIEETDRVYDAVILDLSDPVSLQVNRFYTVEFFRRIRSILKPGGITAFTVRGAANYLSREQVDFISILHATLKDVFPHVLLIPGDRIVIVASGTPLSTDIAALVAARGVETTYMTEDYLAARMTAERLRTLAGSVRDNAPINRDFRPHAYFAALRTWLALFRTDCVVPLGLVTLLFVVYVVCAGTVQRVIFTTGFAASSMQVIILLCYQIVHGSVYSGIGVMIAAFMVGLAVGSGTANYISVTARRGLIFVEFVLVLYCAAYTGFLLKDMLALSPGMFLLLSVIIGTATGAEFPFAARAVFVSPHETGGSLYTADLLGGSMGAFLAGLVLIPFLGIVGTCLLVFMVKCATLTILAITR